MLAHIKEIVKETKKGGYAIGAFNIHNMESALGVAQAAMSAKSPAIIQVSESTIKYMGLKPITHIVSTIAKNVASPMPIALHLDHGSSFNSVVECIKAGFSSVHIDASDLPLDENIAITNEVIDFAHKKGVWVQGEIGPIVGGHGNIAGKLENIPLANFEEVIEFVKKTKIDTLSAAVGTAHGVYKNEDINFKLLKKILDNTDLTFVLHGGSGVDDKKMKKAIKMGVNIINVGSDIKIAFSRTLIKNCSKNPKETDPRRLLQPTIKAVEKVAFKKMELFGSCNKIKINI
jgi:fructose-bisphosphate aldolase, class II